MQHGVGGRRDRGAAAVEFALVTPVLFVLLFGIVQYGYGFFQLQAAQATARETALRAAKGLQDCTQFHAVARTIAEDNGMTLGLGDGSGDDGVRMESAPQPAGDEQSISAAPATPGQAQLGDDLKVTVTYRPQIDLPLVPYPSTMTAHSRTRVETLGDLTRLECP